MVLLSDNRINPYDQSENARPFRLPPEAPNDIQDGIFYEDLAISAVLPSDVIQLPGVGEEFGDKFQLWQESAPASGVFDVRFIQVTGPPSVGQFRVDWGSGRSIIQINFADQTSETGKQFACVYDGLGTANGVKVNRQLLNDIRHVSADETSTTIDSILNVTGDGSIGNLAAGNIDAVNGEFTGFLQALGAITAGGLLTGAAVESKTVYGYWKAPSGLIFNWASGFFAGVGVTYPWPYGNYPAACLFASFQPTFGGQNELNQDYNTVRATVGANGWAWIVRLIHNTNPPYHEAITTGAAYINYISIGY